MLSSVKSFVIAFAVAALIFGIIFVTTLPQIRSLAEGFLNPAAEDTADTEEETYIPPEVPDQSDGVLGSKPVFEGHRSFTLLLIGSDYQPDVFSDYRVAVKNTSDLDQLATHQRHYKADVAVLVRYCAENGTFILSAIPTNISLTVGGIQMKLCEALERKGAQEFANIVSGVVGMTVDYYICCRISLFIDIINRIGGIKFDVPIDMSYKNEEERIVTAGSSRDPIPVVVDGRPVTDSDGNPVMQPAGRAFTINLKRGIQTLNGEKASWVLRYFTYPNGFTSRRETQTRFFSTLFDVLLNEEKHSVLYGIISLINASPAGDTNMTPSDFEDLSNTILSYASYDKSIVVFPCSVSGSGTDERVSFSRSAVYSAFEKYKLQ